MANQRAQPFWPNQIKPAARPGASSAASAGPGGSGSSTGVTGVAWQTDFLAGDGSTTVFTLTFAPLGSAALAYRDVAADAYVPYTGAFSINAQALTLPDTMPSGGSMKVDYICGQ